MLEDESVHISHVWVSSLLYPGLLVLCVYVDLALFHSQHNNDSGVGRILGKGAEVPVREARAEKLVDHAQLITLIAHAHLL